LQVTGFGGWFGPFLMGYMRDLTGDNVVGLAVLSAFLGLSIGLFSIIHVTQRTTQVILKRDWWDQ
jgi:MFS-type transporter involved in bile tolerance (Atg22 family)